MPAQTVIQIRRDTAANWTSANPTLANGEQGYETDTKKLKIGDGTTAWTSLAYFGSSSARLVQESNTTVTVSNTADETDLFSFSQAAVADTCMYRIRAGGTILNNSGAIVTYLLRFKITDNSVTPAVTTTVFASTAANRASDTATRKWTAEWVINMVGAKTSQVITAQYLESSAGSQGWIGIGTSLIGTNTSTIGMGTAATVAFTVDMGTASANANMICNFFTVEEITE